MPHVIKACERFIILMPDTEMVYRDSFFQIVLKPQFQNFSKNKKEV